MQPLKMVLLVDDDEINNFLSRSVLLKSKLVETVKTVTNGQDAIDLLFSLHLSKNSYPELIFLDINMPVMDGFEFLDMFSQIKVNGEPKSKIAMLTTSIRTKDKERSNQFPEVISYLEKPLTLRKLTQVLDNLNLKP